MQRKKINNLEYIEITNKAATAKISLQGAHLFHYQRTGEQPLLWISEASEFKLGKAIRGGVPICWPSFGNNNSELPQHGFARVKMWELVKIDENDPNVTHMTFVLKDSEETRALWNYKFRVELIVSIGNTLQMELRTFNLDIQPFTLTQALHTYFNISSIENVSISGLEEKKYLDALSLYEEIQKGKITFDREVDRVYQGVDKLISLYDDERTINIENRGSNSVVVWNPWIEKCARMSGMQSQGYKGFVCIESANAYEDRRILNPQEMHVLSTVISIE